MNQTNRCNTKKEWSQSATALSSSDLVIASRQPYCSPVKKIILYIFLLPLTAFAGSPEQALEQWIEAGQVTHARSKLTELQRQSGSNRTLSILESKLLLAEKKYSEAIDLTNKLNANHPNDSELFSLHLGALSLSGANLAAHQLAQKKSSLVTPAQRQEISSRLAKQWLKWAQNYSWLFPKGVPLLKEAESLFTNQSSTTNFDLLFAQLFMQQKAPTSLEKISTTCLKDTCPDWIKFAATQKLLERGDLDAARSLLPPISDASPIDQVRTSAFVRASYAENIEREIQLMTEKSGPEHAWMDGIPNTNNARIETELNKAWLLATQEKLSDAQDAFYLLLKNAPMLNGARHGLAQIYYQRQFFDKSIAQYRYWLSLERDSLDARMGLASALLEKKLYGEAQLYLVEAEQIGDPNSDGLSNLRNRLKAATGNKISVVSSARSFDKDNREVQFSADYYSPTIGMSSMRFVLGSNTNFGENALRYKAGLESNLFQNLHGSAGVSYRDINQNFAPWVNLDFRISDHLSFHTQYDGQNLILSQNLLNEEGDSQSFQLGVDYYYSEDYSFRLGSSIINSSDSNKHLELYQSSQIKAYGDARRSYFLGLESSYSRNSLREALYFNPEKDFTLKASAKYQNELIRMRSLQLSQSFDVSAGPYWQTNFATQAVASVTYGQQWNFSERHSIQWALSWNRSAYDGEIDSYPSFSIEGSLVF
jgi:hypothetical protein